ncbi:hypothetical protein ABE142_01890 [Paenibacillus alvei]|uniref:hypothetical protein n=1 Tax=Paenibacillus alvei TaxID=44250 RepID=UPI0013DC7D85|nr:hypothetical protein [Paenibacillus alvei]NEZ40956.1 hypothetical protein [Paenibacillus alvei]
MNKSLVLLIQFMALSCGFAFPFIHVVLRIVMLLGVYFADAVVGEKIENSNRKVLLMWIIGLIIGYVAKGLLGGGI